VGLIVERIVDVVEQALEVEEVEELGGNGGLLGSAVLRERITDLLDVGALVGRATPQEMQA
jgi:hypothetical protein